MGRLVVAPDGLAFQPAGAIFGINPAALAFYWYTI
jgi:hypothetical protein